MIVYQILFSVLGFQNQFDNFFSLYSMYVLPFALSVFPSFLASFSLSVIHSFFISDTFLCTDTSATPKVRRDRCHLRRDPPSPEGELSPVQHGEQPHQSSVAGLCRLRGQHRQ